MSETIDFHALACKWALYRGWKPTGGSDNEGLYLRPDGAISRLRFDRSVDALLKSMPDGWHPGITSVTNWPEGKWEGGVSIETRNERGFIFEEQQRYQWADTAAHALLLSLCLVVDALKAKEEK